MARSSNYFTRFLTATSLAAISVGCSTAPKTASNANLKLPGSPASSRMSLPGLSGKSTTSSTTVSASAPTQFSTSNKLNDPAKVYLAYAVWHEQEGNMVEARNSYNKVLEKSPKNVDAMLGLARLDMGLKRMDDAEQRLLKAQKLAPKNAQVMISLGQYYSACGDLPRALEAMQAARTLSPYDPVCAYHLGNIQAKSGDMESALANFTEAVGAPEAEYNLAYVFFERGNMVAAEEHLQKAIAVKPELAQAQSLLTTVRQQRNGKTMLAHAHPVRSVTTDMGSGIQPASYTEWGHATSTVEQASARK